MTSVRNAGPLNASPRVQVHRGWDVEEGIATRIDEVIRTEGMVAALAQLNARTRFRYTGVYKVEPTLLRNVCLFDRENPLLNLSGGVAPFDAGSCGIVRPLAELPRTSRPGRRSPPLLDPERRPVIWVLGVPVRLTSGIVWGALCHYDLRPRTALPKELAVLEAVALHIVASMDVPASTPYARRRVTIGRSWGR